MSKNLSRRQVIKASGSFVAGAASVTSIPQIGNLVDGFNIVSPAQAQIPPSLYVKKLPIGSQFILQCAPTDNNGPFLNGITTNCGVNMVDSATYPNTGTRWMVVDQTDTLGYYIFECRGHIQTSCKYLDGRTADDSVGLAPAYSEEYPGTAWQVYTDGLYEYFNCLEAITLGRDYWLDGRTADNSVGLAPVIGGIYTGTRWSMLFL